MPYRYFSLVIWVLIAFHFVSNIQAQQILQPVVSNQAWAQPVAQQSLQTAAETTRSEVSKDGMPPVYDPVELLEARLNSMQVQLDSLGKYGESGESNLCGGDSCESGCGACSPTRRGGFFVRAGVVFSKPHYKEAFQYSRTNFATGQQTLVPFNYDYEPTPRIWLGYKRADGLGLRAMFWDFDAAGQTSTNTADGINVYGAHAVNIIFPANIFALAPGETLINSDSLKTQIQNYYLTFDTRVANIDVSGGLGLRYARLEQSLNSVVLDQSGAPIRQLTWQRKYDGLGPAISLDAKRRIGRSPLSIFANGGGSLLFGTKTIERTVLGDQSPQPASPFLRLDDADEVVGIGELGIGVEWSQQLACGHYAKVRGQYEGQLWSEAGAPTLGFLGFEGFGVLFELTR